MTEIQTNSLCIPPLQGLSPWRLPRCIWTTSWSAGPWIRRLGVAVGGPDGLRKPHWAPCQSGTEAPPAAAASSNQISALGGPSRLTPEACHRPWCRAEKLRDWPVSRTPEAAKAHRHLNNWTHTSEKTALLSVKAIQKEVWGDHFFC